MKNSIPFTSTKSISNSEEYQADLAKRIKEQQAIDELVEKGGQCLLCQYNDDPTIIERHHVFGRRSEITIPVCPNCHQILSRRQRSWPDHWLTHIEGRVEPDLVATGLSDVVWAVVRQM